MTKNTYQITIYKEVGGIKMTDVNDEDDQILTRGDVTRLARMESTVHHQEEDLAERVLADSRYPERVSRQDRAAIIGMIGTEVLTRNDLQQGMHTSTPNGKKAVYDPCEYGSRGIYKNH